jgi:hypothetical protein
MRALLIPTTLTAFLALAPFALAATQNASGVVRSVDSKAMTLTLDDGVTYHLPKGFKDPGLKAGEKVSVSWEMKAGQHDAETVKIVR